MPKRHLIIPDTQIRNGVPLDHIDWAARAIFEYRPDVIVVLGDWWDMPSLSSHDAPGSVPMEGARYEEDVKIGNECFERLCAPLDRLRLRTLVNRKKRYDPELHYLFGNHENRIERAIHNEPKYTGVIGLHHLNTQRFQRHPFLEVVRIDDICYSHYFSNVNSGKGIGGSIDNRLNKIGNSFVQGHEQGFLYGCRQFPTGETRHGLVCGSFYQHDEDYKGRQGNGHWRGIVVLNRVENGSYDIMPLRMEYLAEKFA